MKGLELLQTDHVDIYFLHRDNLDVPVGEFVDVLNEHKSAGRIGLFGGSNWSLERIQQANEYAARHGLTGFAAVSNHFCLARMVEPPWPGCRSSSGPVWEEWLTETQTPLFPWSSQARGFFVEGRAHPEDRSDKNLVQGWYSDDNFERLSRAKAMAREKGVLTLNIALAYVLCQPIHMFPLIGPQSLDETWTSLRSLDLELSPEELRWLDLRD